MKSSKLFNILNSLYIWNNYQKQEFNDLTRPAFIYVMDDNKDKYVQWIKNPFNIKNLKTRRNSSMVETIIIADDGETINAQEVVKKDLTVSRAEVAQAKAEIEAIKFNIGIENEKIAELEEKIAKDEAIIALADAKKSAQVDKEEQEVSQDETLVVEAQV